VCGLRLAEVFSVTQSGLMPVVGQWDEQSAAMCTQSSPVLTTWTTALPMGPAEKVILPACTQMGGFGDWECILMF